MRPQKALRDHDVVGDDTEPKEGKWLLQWVQLVSRRATSSVILAFFFFFHCIVLRVDG